MSSEASRNSTRGVMLRVARSLRTQSRSPVKPRERTSITTASWVMREPAARPSSTIRAISSGGRLSATYQPRSSSTLAAVPRPAPDSPVTSTTSMPDSPRPPVCRRHPAILRACPDLSSRCSALIIADNRLRALRIFGRGRRGPPARPWPSRRPMPGTAVISSTLASFKPATDPKCVTSALRRCSPSPRTESSADAVIRLDRLLRW